MLSFSVLTIFLDFFIMFLPVPIVWSLQLPQKQRIAVICIFGAGIIVCVAGVVHAYFVDQALVKSYDETWTGWPLWICSAVEVDLGIVSDPTQPSRFMNSQPLDLRFCDCNPATARVVLSASARVDPSAATRYQDNHKLQRAI